MSERDDRTDLSERTVQLGGKEFPFEQLHEELIEEVDAEFELDMEDVFEDRLRSKRSTATEDYSGDRKGFRKFYFRELRRLQIELVRLQDWVQASGFKLAILFEGRDSAGKGGVIKRITQRLNPRVCKVVALPAPNDRQKTQFYFQRYVPYLPAAGEIVLFDRSWYNRAGVESVMGFATSDQVEQFYEDVPLFEKLITNAGIMLLKFWFSIDDEEQELRFLCRIHDPLKQWKLSPMDLQSRVRWEDYTKAKEKMLFETSFDYAPWRVVEGNDKKHARLNCIRHILEVVPYESVEHEKVELPERVYHENYIRKPVPEEMKVPRYYPD